MPYLGINTDGVKISLIFWTVPVVVIGGCFGASALGRTPLGDMNCDGGIDFADVNPFILALTDPNALRAQVGEDCFLKEQADCNFDGTVDFADIDPFVDFIMGTAEPPDRPMKIYIRLADPPQKRTYSGLTDEGVAEEVLRESFQEQKNALVRGCTVTVMIDCHPMKEVKMPSCTVMACGHPQCCIIGSSEGTNHCGWCEAEARAKHAEELSEYWRHRCIEMQAKLARIASEAVNRDTPPQAADAFLNHLEQASKIVATWPTWAQEMLGGSASSKRVPDALGDADHS